MTANHPYPTSPTWTKDLIIYEIATRTFTSPHGPGSGTLASATEKIPYLANLGITAVWLSGHSLADPTHFYNIWTQYAVIQPDVIDPALGTEDDLRLFIETAHQHGIYVLLELVTHGVMKDSPLVTEHPEWFRGESWGMVDYDFDARHTDFDDWWVALWTRYVLDFGVDGFRLDLGMRRPDLWQRIRQNTHAAGREIVVMNESEYEETVDWCRKSGMTNIAPVEDYTPVVDFAQRDKYTLLDVHHKIPGEVNDHVGRAPKWGIPEWETWLDNALRASYKVPDSSQWAWSTVQLSCHDDGWEDFTGDNPYMARGSRFMFGYAVLFSGLIPIFMAGEEFNAIYQPLPALSPKLFGGERPGAGTWLYGGVVPWELCNEPEHEHMLKDVKRLIAIRKQEAATLSAVPNTAPRNIARLDHSADVPCVSPYMRWSQGKIIIIAGNHYTDRSLSITVRVPSEKLPQATHYVITNLWTNESHTVSRATLDELKIHIPADKTPGGGVAILKITNVWENADEAGLNGVEDIDDSTEKR